MKNILALLISLISLAGFGQVGWDWSHFVSAATGAPTDYIAYYPFNGNANDSTENNFDLTNVNSPAYTTDKWGNTSKCISYVAASLQYSYVNESFINWDTENLTIAGWCFGMGQGRFVFSSTITTYPFLRHRNAIGVQLRSNNNTNYGGSISAEYSETSWEYVVYEWTDTTVNVYINDTLFGSSLDKSAGSFTNMNRFVLGARYYGTGELIIQYENGKVDEIKIFDRLLTTEEKTALYEEVPTF